jgi:hypothetical protein
MCRRCVIIVNKLFNVNKSEMIISADLGSSSNYSNESHFLVRIVCVSNFITVPRR